MRLNPSSSNNLTLHSPVESLARAGRPSKTIEALKAAHFNTIADLMWLIPLRIQKLPVLSEFDQLQIGQLFKGIGKVISVQNRPSFRGRGKGGARLYDLTVVLKDAYSARTISLKWFNTYFSMVKKIETSELLLFMGEVGSFGGQFQITAPEIVEVKEDEITTLKNKTQADGPQFRVQYPTVNKIASTHIKKLIDKIPLSCWNQLPDLIPAEVVKERSLMPLSEALKTIHAIDTWSAANQQLALDRLVYQEFFEEQLKLLMRRQGQQKRQAPVIQESNEQYQALQSLFPYELTTGQQEACQQIIKDLASGAPMMRLVQGDVGCGKTTVALIAALLTIHSQYQAALMCPTESLASQHFKTVRKIFPQAIKFALLTGSTPAKDKKEILTQLKTREIQFIIGTHALIQENVAFKNLGLAIIDEQHKFGVDQRIKLVSKGSGTHCLIMTATPIPRSLSLTQYGDLDITTIRTIPAGQRGQKSRIVTGATFEKFLTFINTRIELGEQVYLVVPAIQENPDTDLVNVEQMQKKISEWLPHRRLLTLHGALKSSEKEEVLQAFTKHEADILLSTSVIEVGIDIHNATVMAVFGPERFGLSSLHQLRGRVGRGEKPGFFFMVAENKLSQESHHRLRILEETTDGFKIAEEDLKIRGEGDLFGKEQSGALIARRLSNIILHAEILNQARSDVDHYYRSEPQKLEQLTHQLAQDDRVFTTV